MKICVCTPSCPLKGPCARTYQHLCMNQHLVLKARLDLTPSEFTGPNTFLWQKSDSCHTCTRDWRKNYFVPEEKTKPKKKDKNTGSFAYIQNMWTLAQSLNRGLRKVSQHTCSIMTPLSISIFSACWKPTSANTTLSLGKSHCLRFLRDLLHRYLSTSNENTILK